MNTIMLCNTSMWMGKSETVDKLGVALVCTWIWNQYYVWHLTAVGSGLIEEYNISLWWALIRDCLCTCVTITFLAHIPALFPSALTVWGVGPPAAPAAHHATPTRVVTHPASHPQGKENGTSMLRYSIHPYMSGCSCSKTTGYLEKVVALWAKLVHCPFCCYAIFISFASFKLCLARHILCLLSC